MYEVNDVNSRLKGDEVAVKEELVNPAVVGLLGKDAAPDVTFPGGGESVGLLLHMCAPTVGRGMVIIRDSGFCVLRGIDELKKRAHGNIGGGMTSSEA